MRAKFHSVFNYFSELEDLQKERDVRRSSLFFVGARWGDNAGKIQIGIAHYRKIDQSDCRRKKLANQIAGHRKIWPISRLSQSMITGCTNQARSVHLL